jgi:hypothetical protein
MPRSFEGSCCASVRRFHKSLKYSHTQHRKPSNTSRNSTTVYRQEAAGRLAEIRQLESAHTGSNKGRLQKRNSMSSEAQQAKNQQANQSIGQYPATSSQHAVEPLGPRGDNPATAGPGPTKVQSSSLKTVSVVPIPPRRRKPTQLRAPRTKSKNRYSFGKRSPSPSSRPHS